jgi:hypothetical protein
MGYVVINVTLGTGFSRNISVFSLSLPPTIYPCSFWYSCITDRVLRDLFTEMLNEMLKNTPSIHIILKVVVQLIYATPWFNYYPDGLAL